MNMEQGYSAKVKEIFRSSKYNNLVVVFHRVIAKYF